MGIPARMVLTGVLVVVLAGCGASEGPGDATMSGPALPPRPFSVAADQVPPCAMLSPDQVNRLGLRRPSPLQAIVDGQPSPGCSWLGSAIAYSVQFIPIGTEVALAVPGSTITRVNEFGAVQNMADLAGSPPICQVAVDVAPSQTIRVQAGAVPNPPYGIDELCRRAEETASMVMTTVVAAAPR